MAGKPVGTIFVELDLDASRYTKGQQKLLKDAQSTTLNIEQNFKNLGIKSSAEMDLMRAKIKNSFDMIANSAKATANDIVRAEEAKNAKLKALNEQQFGAQKSLLGNLKSNWIAYSAAAFAAVKAIDKAIEMAKAGSMLEKQSQAFQNLATAAGTSSQRVIADLKKISGNMVAESDLMTAAGKAMLMSIPADKISELMKIAAATSRMTGQTITEAFNDITMGVARQSKMILDNLGIIVNVDKANEDYAKTLKKTATELSDTEKRQAFMNATLKAGADMISRLGEQKGTLDGVNIALAGTKNAWDEINKSVAYFLDGPLAAYGGMIDAIAVKLKNLRESGTTSDRNEESFRIEQNRMYERFGLRPAGSTSAMMAEFNRKYVGGSEAELADRKRYTDWQKPDAMASWREREGNFAANTEEENKRYLKALEDARKKAEEEAKKSAEVNKTFWEQYKKEVEGAIEFEKSKLDEQYKAFDKYVHDKVALESWYQAEKRKIEIKEYAGGGVEDEKRGFRSISEIMSGSEAYGAESARARAYKANQKAAEDYQKSVEAQLAANAAADKKMNEENWWKTYIEDTEDATRANEIFKDSMNIMSQSAADAFAEFVTGTKSAKDTFTEMAQSMIASMVRISSQKAFEEIFGMIIGSAGGLFGSMFGGGSTATGMGTNTNFIGGGTMGGYIATVKHSGGLGSEPGTTTRIPAWMVASAPSFHTGVGPNEVIAKIRKDEGVFTPGQMAAMGGRSVSINVPVTIAAGDGLDERRLSGRMRDEVEATAKRVLREEMR